MKFIESREEFEIDLLLEKNFLKGAFDKIKAFFIRNFKKDGWLRYMKFLDKKGVLKQHGIIFIPYTRVQDTKVPREVMEASDDGGRVPLAHPDPDVENILPSELSKQIKKHIKLREPLFIWGAPGVGKTAIFKQVGKELKKHILIFNLPLREPTDFIGLPSIDKEKKRTMYNLPDIFPPGKGTKEASNDKYGGIIFFDEMNRAAEMVLRASLQFVLDKRFDTYELADNWDIFAAGNREIDTTDVSVMGSALSNRFSHLNLVTNAKEWEKWATSDDAKNEEGEFEIDPMLINFIRWNEENLHYLPKDKDTPVWASPRSWHKASIEYIKTKKENPMISDDEITLIFSKRVGKAMASQFLGFLKLSRNMKPEDVKLVYSNPGKAPLPPKQGSTYKSDIAWAMMGAIAYYKHDGTLTLQEFDKAIDYAIRLKQAEFAIALINMIVKYNKHIRKSSKFSDIMKKWYSAYKEDFEWQQDVKDTDKENN